MILKVKGKAMFASMKYQGKHELKITALTPLHSLAECSCTSAKAHVLLGASTSQTLGNSLLFTSSEVKENHELSH